MRLSYEDLLSIVKAVGEIGGGRPEVRIRQIEVAGHKILFDREESSIPGDNPIYFVIGITNQEFRNV